MSREAAERITDLCSLSRDEFEKRCRAAASGPANEWAALFGDESMTIKTCAQDPEIAPHLLRDGFWEPWVTMALGRRNLFNLHTWNIGANQGYYTALLRHMVGDRGRVLAVEPQKMLADCIRETIKEHGWENVRVEQAAVGRRNSFARLHLHIDAPGQASLIGCSSHSQSVAVWGLDGLVEKHGEPDVLFCDVEGAEADMFLGTDLLEKRRPLIVTEYAPVRYYAPRALFYYLCELGYTCKRIMLDGSEQAYNPISLLNNKSWSVLVFEPNGWAHQPDRVSYLKHEEGPLSCESASTARPDHSRASAPSPAATSKASRRLGQTSTSCPPTRAWTRMMPLPEPTLLSA